MEEILKRKKQLLTFLKNIKAIINGFLGSLFLTSVKGGIIFFLSQRCIKSKLRITGNMI